MGECGCGLADYERGFRIKGAKAIVSYQVFPGCHDCGYGPGVAISFFDRKGEFLEDVPMETVTPDEYGSNRGGGYGRLLFDIEDLQEAAKELWKDSTIGPEPNQYENLSDWLEDNGYELIREAINRYERRRKPGRS